MPQRNDRKVFFIRSSFARLAHRLTVFFILLWSSCFLELRSEDGYSPARIKFCYDTEKEGHRLNAAVYKELHALSGTDCAVHCVHNHCCRSVNYRKDPVYNGKENCELLHTVASEERKKNLKSDPRYDYYLLLEPERSFDCHCSPCKNNGKCQSTSNCSCVAGFSGKRCDKDSLYSSKILGGDGKYLKQLYQWLNNEMKWKLCYRASEHRWRAWKFHSNCDEKGQTVTIVRVGDYIFGGYSDVDWGGPKGYRKSSKAFLFSLRNKDNLQPFKSSIRSNRTTSAIYTGPSSGPTFGESHDLGISDDSHTSNTSYTKFGHTYQLPPGYSYGTAKTRQLLAGSYYFRTFEIEVYYMY